MAIPWGSDQGRGRPGQEVRAPWGRGCVSASSLRLLHFEKRKMMSMVVIIRLWFRTPQDRLLARGQEDEKECVILKDFKATE